MPFRQIRAQLGKKIRKPRKKLIDLMHTKTTKMKNN